jgi:hypothetical protein
LTNLFLGKGLASAAFMIAELPGVAMDVGLSAL